MQQKEYKISKSPPDLLKKQIKNNKKNSKELLSQSFLSLIKIEGQTDFWSPNKFGPKIFGSKKIGSKRLWSKKF